MQKYKLTIACLFTILSCLSCLSQKELREVELSNGILKEVIEDYIQETKKKNKKFDKFGHLEIEIISFNADSLKYSYFICDQYYNLGNEHSSSARLPSYYTYIDNKIVFFFYPYILMSIKDKSTRKVKKYKKKLSGLLKPYLPVPKYLVIKDTVGKKIINDKAFRPDESFNIHCGIILNIYENDTFEIIDNR